MTLSAVLRSYADLKGAKLGTLEACPLPSSELGKLVRMVVDGKITRIVARAVLDDMLMYWGLKGILEMSPEAA